MPHPPAVLWLPSVAHGACLRCWWLQPSCSSPDGAASAARRHALDVAPRDALDVDLLLAPVPVSQSYAQRDRDAPSRAG